MTGSEIAQTLLDQDGYIVVASPKVREIREVFIDDLSPTIDRSEPAKVVVIGTADREDFIRQMRKVDPRYQWPDIPSWAMIPDQFRFYKVTAE